MSFRILITASLLLALMGRLGYAQAKAPSTEQLAQWLKRFPQADGNKDGKLTAAEADAYRKLLRSKRNASTARNDRKRAGPAPTHANVRYGKHPRNVFDLWLPKNKSEQPLAVFVFFHGGGFVAGDKAGFDPSGYLEAGMAVVSGNYRFVDGDTTLSPVPLQDAARVIQFLRHRAKKWNLDSRRIAVSGSSAGAVIAMWIGFHDDLAVAGGEDVVARQSSRVRCIAPINGPANLDPRWITKNMGGPKHIHGSFPKMFGAAVSESDNPETRKRILESSPFHHLSKDDPPTLLIYSGANRGIPLPESASTGVLIHHPFFGAELKKQLDLLQIPNKFLTQTDPRKNRGAVVVDWLKTHLLAP